LLGLLWTQCYQLGGLNKNAFSHNSKARSPRWSKQVWILLRPLLDLLMTAFLCVSPLGGFVLISPSNKNTTSSSLGPTEMISFYILSQLSL
jgi:hypothetical protein